MAFCFINLTISQAQVDQDQHDVMFTIPEIALLDIEPTSSTITLTLEAPIAGGAPVTVSTDGTDNSKWLNYSSSVSPSATTRNISAHITSGSVPSGISLKLQASAYTGIGAGVLGTPIGLITLNNSPQNIITGIGGAYTGDGSTNGHQLTFTLSLENYGLLDNDNSTTIEVTFTITD
jgi:hypothetical protein